jgi:hypothetical protein
MTDRSSHLKTRELKNEITKMKVRAVGNKNKRELKTLLVQEMQMKGLCAEVITITEYEHRSVEEIVRHLGWRSLEERRKIFRLTKLYKAFRGEKLSKAMTIGFITLVRVPASMLNVLPENHRPSPTIPTLNGICRLLKTDGVNGVSISFNYF